MKNGFQAAALLPFLLAAQAVFAQGSPREGHPSIYYTPLIQETKLSCDVHNKTVFTEDGKAVIDLCLKEYRQCQYQGSCVIEKKDGSKIGISYYRYDEEKDQSYFQVIKMQDCPYGYGFGKISESKSGLSCLIPYFSVSADPLEHTLGDVIYVPKLKGVVLPSGEIHDGYLVVTDYDEGLIGTGQDRFVLFTGHQSLYDAKNVFKNLGLDNYDNVFAYENVTGKKAEAVRAQRKFKIVAQSRHVFKARTNPMLEDQ